MWVVNVSSPWKPSLEHRKGGQPQERRKHMNICKEEDRAANATRAEKLSCVLPRKAPTTITRHSWAGTWLWEPEQDPMAVGNRKGRESAGQPVWKAKSLPVLVIPEESRPTAVKNIFSSVQVFYFNPGSLEINTHQRQNQEFWSWLCCSPTLGLFHCTLVPGTEK